MSIGHSSCGECWRPVVGFEKWYEISCRGRVKTHHTIGRRCLTGMLAAQPNTKGYLRVCLSDGARTVTRVVHRLVLEAFGGSSPSPAYQCNHKNAIKTDNRIDNLEWVTGQENVDHSMANGLWKPHLGENHGRAKLTEADVRTIRSCQGIERQIDVARRYGVSGTAIKLIWKRKNWAHVK